MANKKTNFNLMDTLNKVSRGKTDAPANDGADIFKPQMISVHNLTPSASNFYDTTDVLDLKRSIEMLGGVKQNLIVKPTALGKYEIISGHRRHKACAELVAEGLTRFEFVPCIVESGKDPLIDGLLLIMTNSTARELTEREKCRQAEELKTLLGQLKEREHLPGRVREMVAAAMNVSESQVARYDAINANLGADAKKEFENGTVPMSVAYEMSKKPKEEQAAAVEEYKATKEKPHVPFSEVPKGRNQPMDGLSEFDAPCDFEDEDEPPEAEPKIKVVYVCSAYRGKPPYSPSQRGMNLCLTIDYCKQVVKEGNMPVAPHVICADFLNDDDEKDRATGLKFAAALIERCDEVRVFGDYVTEGMAADIGAAKKFGKPIVWEVKKK